MTDDELKQLLASNASEIRGHFDVSTEEMKNSVRLVAESAGRIEEKLDRSVAALEERIERTSSETQSMLRFSPL